MQPMIGEATPEERQLTGYLMNGLAHYVGQKPVDRSTLIAALSQICKLVFTDQTPFDIKQQCKEIDDFCLFLKNQAMRNAVRS